MSDFRSFYLKEVKDIFKGLILIFSITLLSSCGVQDRLQEKANEIEEDVKNKTQQVTDDMTEKVDEIKTEFTETKEKVENKIEDVTNAIDAVNKVFEDEESITNDSTELTTGDELPMPNEGDVEVESI